MKRIRRFNLKFRALHNFLSGVKTPAQTFCQLIALAFAHTGRNLFLSLVLYVCIKAGDPIFGAYRLIA